MTTFVTAAGASITTAVSGLGLATDAKIRDFTISVARSDTGSEPGEGVIAAAIIGAEGPVKTIKTGTGSSIAHATSDLGLEVTDRVEKVYIGHGCNVNGSAIGVEIAVLVNNTLPY